MQVLRNIINFGLFGFGTAVFWSPAIKDIFVGIVVFGIIFAISQDESLRHTFKKAIFSNTFAILSILVFLVALIGTFYINAPISLAVRSLQKYVRFLFPPLLLTWFAHEKKSSAILLNGLTLGTFLFAVVSISLNHNRHTNINPIPISVIFAAVTLVTFMRVSLKKNILSYYNSAVILALTANIAYLSLINKQKTGIVCFVTVACLASIALFFIIKSPKFIKINAVILLLISSLVAYVALTKNARLSILNDGGGAINFATSSYKERVDIIKNGIKLASEAPIFGNGTGSFGAMYADRKIMYLGTYTDKENSIACAHNDYINIVVQFGIFGLIIFLLWFVSPIFCSRSFSKFTKISIFCIVICYSIAACFDLIIGCTFTKDVYFLLISSMLAQGNVE